MSRGIDISIAEAAGLGGTYTALTRVPGVRLSDHATAREPMEVRQFVRTSLTDPAGTPEFRAWLDRAATRLGVA